MFEGSPTRPRRHGAPRRAVLLPVLVLSLVWPAACDRGTDPSGSELRVISLRPRNKTLFLNQSITVVFDRPIDPVSVTKDTVRLVDEAGDTVAIERFKVGSHTISILPVVPIDPDLSDGSFQPGRRYDLALPSYPRTNSVRGAEGEILVQPLRRSWRAVSQETLPEGFPSPLLPSAGRIYLQPRTPVARSGEWVDLLFNKPVFPPSCVVSAFVLRRWGKFEDLGLESAEILPHSGVGGRGSVVRLRPARALLPGSYKLFLRSGLRGLLDYGLNPARVIPTDRNENNQLAGDLGTHYWVIDVRTRPPPSLVSESFASRRAGIGDDEPSLPAGIDGALDWGPDGVRMPRLGFRDFRSLGELRPAVATTVLQPGAKGCAIAPDEEVDLPMDVWDFDRVRIPPGRTYIVLKRNRPLRIRVAGKLEILGDLVFRIRGPRVSGSRRRLGVYRGDPRPVWEDFAGHVAIEVGGVARLNGRILREAAHGAGTGTIVPGYVWTRGALIGKWSTASVRIQIWRRSAAKPAAISAPPVPLPGKWVAISPWYEMDRPTKWLGKLILEGAAPGLEVLVQGIDSGPERKRHAWAKAPGIDSWQQLHAIRFAVQVRDGQDTGEALLRKVTLR